MLRALLLGTFFMLLGGGLTGCLAGGGGGSSCENDEIDDCRCASGAEGSRVCVDESFGEWCDGGWRLAARRGGVHPELRWGQLRWRRLRR
jgi:hypothetical protein